MYILEALVYVAAGWVACLFWINWRNNKDNDSDTEDQGYGYS